LLAQGLDQLQPFTAVFPPECTGQLAPSFWANLTPLSPKDSHCFSFVPESVAAKRALPHEAARDPRAADEAGRKVRSTGLTQHPQVDPAG
jgi:hypothetical protein